MSECRKISIYHGEEMYDCSVIKEAKPEEGTFLGWFVCTTASSSFTLGCEYDWYKNICECKGQFRPINKWR